MHWTTEIAFLDFYYESILIFQKSPRAENIQNDLNFFLDL